MSTIVWSSVLVGLFIILAYQVSEAKTKEHQKYVNDLKNRIKALKEDVNSSNAKWAATQANTSKQVSNNMSEVAEKAIAPIEIDSVSKSNHESKICELQEIITALNKRLESAMNARKASDRSIEEHKREVESLKSQLSSLVEEKKNMRREVQFKVYKEVETMIVEKTLAITNLSSQVTNLKEFIKKNSQTGTNFDSKRSVSSKSQNTDRGDSSIAGNSSNENDLSLSSGSDVVGGRQFDEKEHGDSDALSQRCQSLEKGLEEHRAQLASKEQQLAEADNSMLSLKDVIKAKDSEIKYWQQKYDNERAEYETVLRSVNPKEELKFEQESESEPRKPEPLQRLYNEVKDICDEYSTVVSHPGAGMYLTNARKNSESSSGSDSFEIVKHEDSKSASEEFEDLTESSKLPEVTSGEITEQFCLDILKRLIKSMAHKINDSKLIISHKDSIINDLSKKSDDLKMEMVSCRNQLGELKSTYEEQRRQDASKLDMQKRLQDQLHESKELAEKQKSLDALEKKLEEAEDRSVTQKHDTENFKSQLEEQKIACKELEEKLMTVEENLNREKDESHNLREMIENLTNDRKSLMVKVESANTRFNDVENTLEIESAKLVNQEQHSSELERRIQQLESDLRSASEENSKMKNEITTHCDFKASTEETNKQLSDQLADLKDAQEDLKKHISTLKDLNTQLSEEKDRHKNTANDYRIRLDELERAHDFNTDSRDSTDDEGTYLSKILELETELQRSKSDIEKQRAILNRNFEIIREYKSQSASPSASSSPRK